MSYTIADEPHETSLGAYVVNPSAPLLASMMCGAWMTWPWFAFNAIAMGSPTKKKELTLCAIALGGTVLLGWLALALVDAGWIPLGTPFKLAMLGISTWKLALAYYISTVQSRTFHVYEYYGGTVRAAGAIIGTGFWIKGIVFALSDDPLWIIIVSGGL
ncbi:MAG: hypothetical protein H0T42_22155 [Deltaproteobacteria bacterium]|nr:hypothetical protein [Deltaproteobacteria bacterium]